MNDDQMMDDNMMSSPMPSASATASPMPSASSMPSASAPANPMVSEMGDEMMSARAPATASPLPRTGGTPLLPLLPVAALALKVGPGIVAALVRWGTPEHLLRLGGAGTSFR